MRLLLVRHGRTPSNTAHLLDTAVPGADLDDVGRAQADALADLLQDQGVEAVTASTLVRTGQTAAPLAARLGLTVTVDDGLREIGAGDLEMLGDRTSVERYIDLIATWTAGDLAVAGPGAEDGRAFFARFDAAVDRAVRRAQDAGHGTVVLVSHGAAIRTWAGARARNLDGPFVVAAGLLNTGVVELEGDPGAGWTCTAWAGAAVHADRARVAAAGPAGEPGPVF